MTSFLSKAILPAEVTPFEASYVKRVNDVAFLFFLGHLPVFVALAYFNDTGPFDAVWLTLLAMAGPGLGHRTLKSPRHLSLVYGFTAMLMGGLLVHFGQGPVQIEMHFYFFALLAMLAVYANPMVIIVAAVTVALHHLLLWMYLPASVFNYDAPLWVVLVHAAFVVLESVATCTIARGFFDNVIGLEKIVKARTAELRLVLDNVDQGFLTIDPTGAMAKEHSGAVDRWFGAPQPAMKFWDLLSRLDPDVGDAFEFGFEQVTDDILPLDLSLGQLPAQLKHEGRTYQIAYTPITNAGDLERILIVISDISEAIERERLEAEQRQVMRVFERIMQDKNGFLEFFKEAQGLVDDIVDGNVSDSATLTRVVHTLKGNCMLFGIHSVADHCHEMETRMVESGDSPSSEDREALDDRWTRVRHSIETFVANRDEIGLEIEDGEYEELLIALVGDVPRLELAKRVAAWRLEPTAVRLDRVRKQIEGVAARLGRDEPSIQTIDNGLRLDAERWAPFWATFAHAVRNAVDHGIEGREERLGSGKPAQGTVRVSTERAGGRFSVSLEDDGRGINWDRVRERALERGLPAESQDDLVAALFGDGVSTADEVTQFSGRGIGMGALRQAASDLDGSVSVESTKGRGTIIRFDFPAHVMADDILERLASKAA